MKQIDSSELSAYLDGELDAARAAEVQTAVANDPQLQAAFDALAAADAGWRAAARSAAFHPVVRLPPGTVPSASVPGVAAILTVLVAVRLLPKLTGVLAWGLYLHCAVLALMMVWVIRMAQAAPDTDAALPPPGPPRPRLPRRA